MAGDIHLIEKMGNITCLDKDIGLWESGWWAISSDTAKNLVGGHIYFHKAQDKPSFFGGRIVDFRIEAEGVWSGRILFKFSANKEFKGVRAGREGWSMEKKILFASTP